MRISIIFILFLFTTSCTKKEYIIEEPKSLPDTITPGTFTININNITDKSAVLNWESSVSHNGEKIKYDIAINDSVIAYEIESNSFFIKDLLQDAKYKVSVYAIDPQLNSTLVSGEFQTMKSFVQCVIAYDFDFQFFSFDYAIETSDKGILIAGRVTETLSSDPYRTYIMKLTKSHVVEWIEILNISDFVKNMIESRTSEYLVVMDRSVIKLSKSGAQLWNYKNTDTGSLPSLDCIAEDSQGNYYVAGLSNKKIAENVNLPYTLIKLSSSGEEIWFKYGGTALNNRPHDILIDQNQNIIIFGSAESFWLLWCNSEGEFIDQKFYPSLTNEEDMAGKIKLTMDNNYLLLGTATGGSFQPRFLKVTHEGIVIWDNYYNLNSGGAFANFVDYTTLENDGNLILTNDDRGIAISIINRLGELEKHIKLYGYPSCKLIRCDNDGNYNCVTNDGRIIIFNHDGYIE